MEWIAFLLVGAVAGVLGGLFGIGGGLIIVPVLILTFKALGYSADILTQMAVATSLATIIFTGFSSVVAHNKRKAVEWPTVKQLSLGIVFGTMIGSYVAVILDGQTLAMLIGLFAWFVAYRLIRNAPPKVEHSSPSNSTVIAVGGGIGALSALFGIGGGSLTVPYLLRSGRSMVTAVASAAACGLPIAIVASVSYIIIGWGHPALPDYSAGLVNGPAFVGVVLTSIPGAKLGAHLAHRWPPLLLKRIFAGILILIGAKFLFF